MGFWTQFMTWLGVDSAEDPALRDPPSRVVRRSQSTSRSTISAYPDAGTSVALLDPPSEPEDYRTLRENIQPWWRPDGPLVTQPPRYPAPARTADPASLESAVLTALEGMLNDPNVELPHLPHVPQQVLAVLRQDTAGMAQIARVAAQDQVMAAALLRRANSAALRGATRVTTLEAALLRLGTRGIRSAVIAESLKHLTVTGGGKSRGAAIWRESLAAGYVMEAYAQQLDLRFGEPLLLGLMHDIGKVVVLRACSDAERSRGGTIDAATFEYLCQEFHEMMGEMIVDHWRLPEEIGGSIRNHHGPIEPGQPDAGVRALLQLTDATVALLGHGPAVAYDLLSTPAAIHLALADNDDFTRMLESLPETIHELMGESMDDTRA